MKSWKTPTPEQVAKAIALIGHAEQYRYFFDHLQNPEWIRPLKDAGFFSSPPPPVRDEVRETISFPPWPESRYLARMASLAPGEVLAVVRKISTENVSVNADCADAALALPPDLAAECVPLAIGWLNSPYQILLPERLGALISKLSAGGQAAGALALAREHLALFPDKRLAKLAEEDQTGFISPEARARFDPLHYEHILTKNVPDLVAAESEKAILLLSDLLERAIELSLRRPEREDSADFSYIWRPRIESTNGSIHGLKDVLTGALLKALLQVGRRSPELVPQLIEGLDRRRWPVFNRLALHLLGEFPELTQSQRERLLAGPARFDDPHFHREYRILLKRCFPTLSGEVQKVILEWIAAGPDLEIVRKNYSEFLRRTATDEDIIEVVKDWRLSRLEPIADYLPADRREEYEALVRELGPARQLEEPAHRVSFFAGPISPKPADELKSMAPDELFDYLRNWIPPEDPRSASVDGLARQVMGMVSAEPGRFADNAKRFSGLNQLHVHAFFDGLREAAAQGRPFPWAKVFELATWALEQPRDETQRVGMFHDPQRVTVWTRKSLADLLDSGLSAGPAEIPVELREQVWRLLRTLTRDPDPDPARESPDEGSTMGPSTLSINTVRGQAMHATVKYALWVRRSLEREGAVERLGRGFEEMPEIREVLDSHLDPQEDRSAAIRSVYGQWLPWLVLLDRAWATSRVPFIFPSQSELAGLRNAAWETYIFFCAPYNEAFQVLREEYIRAIDRIGPTESTAEEPRDAVVRLGDHLLTFYWRGLIELDGPESPLGLYFDRAPAKTRGGVLRLEGHSLVDEETGLPANVLERLKRFWEWRLERARAASAEDFIPELAAFGWWFSSGKFDDEWSLDQLASILDLGCEPEPAHMVVERLAELSTKMPRKTVECLSGMVENDREGWTILGWDEGTRKILSIAISGDDPDARASAIALVHRLGTRGYFGYRDLLPTPVAS